MYTFRDIVLANLQKPVLLACDAELLMILIGWDFLLTIEFDFKDDFGNSGLLF